ncbi:DUF58 domain-containing protein [Algicella marina]|uniref:DUF58 domain-containing protein n=1 Tax=Algicella marina TaxID=2683284 RepID=A0A6P1T142_9RHOB|nr:DUF58 domain-containing protein [Algicella marina]QHQ35363.1 DUF58 domain-containing protein [Algicella marina]
MSLPRTTGAEVSLDRLVSLADHVVAEGVPGLSHGLAGGLSGPRRGDGGDLFDLRPFQEGDDLRRIDPAATARSGRPQVRSRHEEVERTLMLVADFRGPMLWGTRGRFRSVAAAEALALEGWRAVLAGGRVGIMIVGNRQVDYLAPRARETAMLRVAEVLVRAHTSALADFQTEHDSAAALLDVIIERIAPGTAVRLATGLDEPGPDFGPAAAALMRKCPLEVLLVQDAVEAAPPRGSFSARIGSRIAKGRFGPSASADLLSLNGIPTRIVPAADPFVVSAA